MDNLTTCIYIATFFAALQSVDSLECYACRNQDSNKDKCIKTTIQCEEHQDACRTEVKWGLPPYWTPYGERFHYVDKECDTREHCNEMKAASISHCKRDWFDDWACVECCTGDLCNYYVTLAADSLHINRLLSISAPTLSVLLLIYRFS